MNRLRAFLSRHFGGDHRRSSRYDVSQPLVIKVAGEDVAISGTSMSLSDTGILLQADSCIPQGTRVKLKMDLPGSPVRTTLHGSGTVVRVSKLLNEKFESAVEFNSVELIEAKAKAS